MTLKLASLNDIKNWIESLKILPLEIDTLATIIHESCVDRNLILAPNHLIHPAELKFNPEEPNHIIFSVIGGEMNHEDNTLLLILPQRFGNLGETFVQFVDKVNPNTINFKLLDFKLSFK
jgi:hypothetical protein